MFRWIPNIEALCVLGPVMLSGLCSPVLQQQLDQRIAELSLASLVQEQDSNFCDINDKFELSKGMDIVEAGQEIDMGDWAEEKKKKKEQQQELETSIAADQPIAGASGPPPDLDNQNLQSNEIKSDPPLPNQPITEEQQANENLVNNLDYDKNVQDNPDSNTLIAEQEFNSGNDSDQLFSNAELADSIDKTDPTNAESQDQSRDSEKSSTPLLEYSPPPLLEYSTKNSNQEIANQVDSQPNSTGDMSNTQEVDDANSSKNDPEPSVTTEPLSSNQSLANEIDPPSAVIDDSSHGEDNHDGETNI